jgi:hypothetical protein
MVVIFFECEGTVHQEFVPPGQTVNQHYYREVLQCLTEQIHQKVQNDGGTTTCSFNMTICWCTLLCRCSNFWPLKTRLWSPPALHAYLAHCAFFSFQRMKSQTKGCRFRISQIHESLTTLYTIPKCLSQWCFQQWQKMYTCCINLKGDLF